ncbi:hypothetical protein BJ170DRAFT_715735 [Xylariales sp. AK1849]|nr:hypothetical protein BJ170DRAFT_715735 [Xylariales sp. AK1849]
MASSDSISRLLNVLRLKQVGLANRTDSVNSILECPATRTTMCTRPAPIIRIIRFPVTGKLVVAPEAARALAFEIYISPMDTLDRVAIFTDFQSDNDLGTSVALEYEAAARQAGRRLLPIYITRDTKENIR